MKSVLLIGPMENKKDQTKTGGVIVLFLDLLYQFRKHNIDYTVIDTNKENYTYKIIALLSIWIQLLIKTRQYDHISLHGTANDYIFIAPVAVLFAKLNSKSISLRKFAGSFEEIYSSLHFILKFIVTLTLKKSDANFFETRYLVEYFRKLNPCTYWFPNVRVKPNVIRTGRFKKRFVFIGTITREKGIFELLEASNLLDNSYTIDLYGPLGDDFKTFDFSPYHAVYRKALRPNQVMEILRQYDVLILPSYQEGYPGVVIESLSIGLPIIVTDLAGIKEMIDEKCAIFINPKSTNDIKKSVEYFDENNYKYFSNFSLESFKMFDSESQTSKFINTILQKE